MRIGYFLIAAILLFTGCADPAAVVDRNVELGNHTWSYANKLKYDVKIDDENALYNLYFNLRVTGGYKYSNIFVIFNHGQGKTRYEFKLANPDGEWLGAGAGNVYSYRFLLRSGQKFPAKGTYHFEIEQNMRDNPLHEVSDAGLRVEKVK